MDYWRHCLRLVELNMPHPMDIISISMKHLISQVRGFEKLEDNLEKSKALLRFTKLD